MYNMCICGRLKNNGGPGSSKTIERSLRRTLVRQSFAQHGESTDVRRET